MNSLSIWFVIDSLEDKWTVNESIFDSNRLLILLNEMSYTNYSFNKRIEYESVEFLSNSFMIQFQLDSFIRFATLNYNKNRKKINKRKGIEPKPLTQRKAKKAQKNKSKNTQKEKIIS